MKNKLTYLHYIIYGSLAVLLVIPLYVADSMYFPYITGKNLVFRCITILVTACWLILWFKDRSYKPKRSLILIGMLIWVGWMLVANLFGVSPSRSIWGNFERMEGWVTLLHIALLFLSLSAVLRTRIEWHRVFNTSLVISIIPILHATVEHFNGLIRADAAFGNSTYLGGYAMVHAFFALLSLWWWRESHKHNWSFSHPLVLGYGVLFLLQVWTIYITGTRGSLLGLVGGIGLSALFLALKGRDYPKLRKVSVIVLIFIAVSVGGFVALRNTPFVQNNDFLSRLADVSRGTAMSRVLLWDTALDAVKERPVTGWGQESFIFAFSEYFNPKLAGQEPWFDRTHNVILDWLVAGGIVGLLAYLFLYIGSLIVLWRIDRPFIEKILFTGLLGAYFIHNFFVFDNITSYILFVLMLSYLHVTTVRQDEKAPSLIQEKSLRNTAIGFVCIAGIYALSVCVFPFGARASALIDALYAYRSNPETALPYFEKAFKGRGVGFKEEVSSSLAQNTAQLLSSEAYPLEVKQAYVATALKELQENITLEPINPRPYLFVGLLGGLTQQYDMSLEAFGKARDLSPQKQLILFQYAGSLMELGRDEEALEVLAYAYELEPSFREARDRYAAVLVYSGDISKAEQLLQEGEPVYSSFLIQAYYEQNYHDKVYGLIEKNLIHNPHDIQMWVSLAAAYNEAGLSDKAREVLDRAVHANPDFKTEANSLKNQIK